MNTYLKYAISLCSLFVISCTGEEPSETPGENQTKYFRPVSDNSSKWISKILDYSPAPGQFINKSPGLPADAEGLIGKKGMVTLGAYGGSVTFQFDHTVLNKEGYDFLIHGNAFKGSSEPGIVQVSIDSNGNGLADDEWYELAGDNHKDRTTVHGYELIYVRPDNLTEATDIIWRDNSNKNGVIEVKPTQPFHKQSYWPLFTAKEKPELSFKGTRLADLNIQNESGTWVNQEAGMGYCDNFSEEYMTAVNGDNDTKGSNKFDISNAVNAKGDPVELPGIDFVKVYTCVHQYSGWLGETSTEVCGAISLTCKK